MRICVLIFSPQTTDTELALCLCKRELMGDWGRWTPGLLREAHASPEKCLDMQLIHFQFLELKQENRPHLMESWTPTTEWLKAPTASMSVVQPLPGVLLLCWPLDTTSHKQGRSSWVGLLFPSFSSLSCSYFHKEQVQPHTQVNL